MEDKETEILKYAEFIQTMSDEEKDIFLTMFKDIRDVSRREEAISGTRPLIIYGTKQDPDCISCKVSFDMEKIKYEFRDINDELKYLKEFIRIRDNSVCFDEIKRQGKIGIPCIYISDEYQIFDWKKFSRQNMESVYNKLKEESKAKKKD